MILQIVLTTDCLSLRKGKTKKTLFIFISLEVMLKNYSQHEYHFRFILFSGFFFIKKNFLPFQAQKNMKYVFAIYSLQHSPAIIMHGIVFYANDLFSFFDRVLLQKFYLLPKYHRDKGSIKSST